MTKKLQRALEKQKASREPYNQPIAGILGIPLDGQRRTEVPGRNAYVYVRLRSNQSEVIQAYNNKVSPSYDLPVLVKREGNRYVVFGVDTQRYENNWSSQSPFLPRHGNTHSFAPESGGGGDIVWVYPNQFTPALIFPSGSTGADSFVMMPYTLRTESGWKYVGNTGTPSLSPYIPATGAIMGLVYLDEPSGNPYILIGSGTVFPESITGTAQVVPYIPVLPSPETQIPLAAVRLVTGTNVLSWNNVYDVRQWLHVTPTGTGGGGSSVQNAIISSNYEEVFLTTGSTQNLKFNTELFDDNNLVSIKAGNLKLVFNQAGWFSINTVVQYAVHSGTALTSNGKMTITSDNNGPFDNAYLDVFTKSGDVHYFRNAFLNSSVEMSVNDEYGVIVQNDTNHGVQALVQEVRIQKL